MPKKLIQKTANNLCFLNLTNPTVVAEFLKILRYNVDKNTHWHIDIAPNITIFPNATTPITALINYYKTNHAMAFSFEDKKIADIFEPNIFEQPTKAVLNKVWNFKSYDDVYNLQIAFIEELEKSDAFAADVLNSLEWSLNEVMDNVIQHSAIGEGYVMGQIHKTSRHVAFCICDTGIGIYNSLKDSVHAPQNPQAALAIAVRERITRDQKIGQGNGLFGLHEIVKYNKGRLNIHSNGAIYTFINDEESIHNGEPTISTEIGCTLVDFQLDYQNAVSLQNVFPQSSMAINHRLEDLENDRGEILYALLEKRYGYGTRKAGEIARNEVINYHNSTKSSILIDFSNINIISSSFADEFIGKLVIYFGFVGFNNIIQLKNMNNTVQTLIQRAVTQRLAESFNA